jgi:hypothetical protein
MRVVMHDALQTLGPNIRENLLKSLGTKVMPTSSVAVTSGGKKSRDPMDVNAKRKHQITYLAKVVRFFVRANGSPLMC